MTHKAIAFCILLLVCTWLAMGCTASLATPVPTPTPMVFQGVPEIISHDKPNLATNTEILHNVGCVQNGISSSRWDCKSNNAIAALGCDEIIPDDLLAGLTPSYPVMRCEQDAPFDGEPPEHFKRVGCMFPRYTSYILLKNGEYRLITKGSELQAIFAPVESADEALSYALVATDLQAWYGIKDYAQYQSASCCFVNKIEDTHVEQTTEGFLVHLFDAQGGCSGTHSFSAIDALVTRDGQTKKVNTELITEWIGLAD